MEAVMTCREVCKSVILSLVVLLPASSLAQTTGPPCGERSDVVNALMRWGEFRVARGLSDDGRLVEIFTGPSGSWTIIGSAPVGTACLIVSGEAWEAMVVQMVGHLQQGQPGRVEM
jgi:hypothetical protein